MGVVLEECCVVVGPGNKNRVEGKGAATL